MMTEFIVTGCVMVGDLLILFKGLRFTFEYTALVSEE
jgi:hypothetical protein